MIELTQLVKSFGSQQVLCGLDLTISAGEKVAILGESGTGKSTLARILAGLTTCDQGDIVLDTTPWRGTRTQDAAAVGIGVLHQHSAIIDSLSVAENLMLGRSGGNLRSLWAPTASPSTAKQAAQLATVELAEAGLLAWADLPATALSALQRRKLEWLRTKAIARQLLVLDEATDALDPIAAQELFGDIVAGISAADTVLYLGHRLDQAQALGCRILVLQQGRLVPAAAEPGDQIRAGARTQPNAPEALPVVTSAQQIPKTCFAGTGLRSGESADALIRNAELQVRPGEIVGVRGRGAEQLPAIIFGGPATDGQMTVRDRPLPARHPTAARDALVGYLDWAGHQQPLAERSLWRALKERLSSKPTALVERGGGIAALDGLVFRLRSVNHAKGTTCPGLWRRTVLRRWLLLPPTLLIVCDPWYGLDLTAEDAVTAAIGELAAAGMGVLIIDRTDRPLTAICDRVLTVREGQLCDGSDTTQ